MKTLLTPSEPENRIGRFRVDLETFRKHWPDWLHLFSNFVVVQTQFSYATMTTEYTAYSPLFDVAPPFYDLELADMPGGITCLKSIRCQ